jgi:WD40 repeat protein/tRNA A-37 threonylcarbamoyl transferase component Bud32
MLLDDTPAGNCPRCLLNLARHSNLEPEDIPSGPGPSPWEFRYPPGCLGNYEILEEIGRGGMGVVYKARQISLDRIVAVKVMAPAALTNARQRRRFETEAAAAARLHHPAIVTVHEIGDAEGRAFFSMEYVCGRTLAELVSERPLKASKAAGYVGAIAEAIHYAHEQGVLHRDLKPSNILIDTQDNPRVTDFGLAKWLAADEDLTVPGTVLGTPNYMPPEQADHAVGNLTPASDVYSLGAILYYCLTGKPPFLAETLSQLLTQVLHTEPVRPTLLNPSIPADLETICLKCLNKLPAGRYPSAAALAADLARWRRGEPIRARPTSPGERAWRWCRRRPALSALGIALGLAVVCGILGISWQWQRAEARAGELVQMMARANLALARAERRTIEAGRRSRALDRIAAAAKAGFSNEARDEAIAALALPDLRLARAWTYEGPAEHPIYSPDLQQIAIPDWNGGVRIVRATDQQLITRLPAAGRQLIAQTISPCQRWLGAQSRDASITVWDLSSRAIARTWAQGKSTFCFTPVPDTVLISRAVGMAELASLPGGKPKWAISTGKFLAKLKPQPLGKWFAGVEEGGRTVELRLLATGELCRALELPVAVGCLAWSLDGAEVWAGLENGEIRHWNAESGEPGAPWRAHADSVVEIGFSPDGQWVATESWDGSLKLWEWPRLDCAVAAHGFAMPYQATFSPDSRWLAFVMAGKQCSMLEVVPPAIWRRIPLPAGNERGAWSLDVSPDGQILAVGHVEGFELVASETGRILASERVSSVRTVVFSANGARLWTCGEGGAYEWAIDLGDQTPPGLKLRPVRRIDDNVEVQYGSLSPDEGALVAAHPGGSEIIVYELAGASSQFALSTQTGVSRTAISPDGRWIASTSWPGVKTLIWDLAGRKVVIELPGIRPGCIRFSPDGRLLAVGAEDYQVFETGAWREVYRGPQAVRPSGVVAFSADSQTLGVVAITGHIQLLKAHTGELIATLEAPTRVPISSLQFSRDGTRLFALESGRSVEVWDLRQMHAELAKLNLDWK